MTRSLSWILSASLQCQHLLPSQPSQPACLLICSFGHILFQPAFEDVCQVTVHVFLCFSDLCTSPPPDSNH